MKKNIFIIIFFLFPLLTSKVAFGNNSQEFIEKLSSCSEYIINTENKISAIMGWSNRECHYKEVSHNESVVCGFKILELKDVINILNKENFDYTKGIISISNLEKIIKNPEICEYTKRK